MSDAAPQPDSEASGMSKGDVVIFFSDDGQQLAQVLGVGAVSAVQAYVNWIREALLRASNQKQYSHVCLLETSLEMESGHRLQVAIADSVTEASAVFKLAGVPRIGAMAGVKRVRYLLDVHGLLMGTQSIPAVLASKVSRGPGGELEITDNNLGQAVNGLLESTQLRRHWKLVQRQGTEALLRESLQRCSEFQESTALSPYSVLQLALALMAEGLEEQEPQGGNPLHALGSVFGGIWGAQQWLRKEVIMKSVSHLRSGTRKAFTARRLVWRAEDALGAIWKNGLRLARRAARPLAIAAVLHMTHSTLRFSQNLLVQTAKQPEHKMVDFYYTKLLGKDYQQQFAADMEEAIQEVEQGLITDDYAHEKRKIAANILRELEVAEWDKQRLKLHILKKTGVFPLADELDAHLVNPFFIESRGWNEPATAWVGENTTFNDIDQKRAAWSMVAVDPPSDGPEAELPPAVRAALEESLSRRDTAAELRQDPLIKAALHHVCPDVK